MASARATPLATAFTAVGAAVAVVTATAAWRWIHVAAATAAADNDKDDEDDVSFCLSRMVANTKGAGFEWKDPTGIYLDPTGVPRFHLSCLSPLQGYCFTAALRVACCSLRALRGCSRPAAAALESRAGEGFLSPPCSGRKGGWQLLQQLQHQLQVLTGHVGSARARVCVCVCVTSAVCVAAQVAGIDAAGYVLGAAVAAQLGTGFLAVRKGGSLCVATDEVTYSYSKGRGQRLEMRREAFPAGTRVAIVDQWVDSGGSMRAAIKLVERQQGVVAAVVALCIESGPSPAKQSNAAWLRAHCPCVTLVPPESDAQRECNAHWLSSWGQRPVTGGAVAVLDRASGRILGYKATNRPTSSEPAAAYI
jgi:adenine phosphoribosyltransferase